MKKEIVNRHGQIFELLKLKFLPSLFDLIGINYSVIDKDGNYLVQNNLAKNQISKGLDNASMIDEETWKDCKKTMDSGEKQIKEERFKNKFYFSIKQPIMGSGNECFGMLVLSLDITEKKQAEQMKLKFLENIRHDIRTPLTGIIGFANLLKHESVSDTTKRYADNIVASGKALLDYLNSVLEIVRFNEDSTPVLHQKFNLQKTLQSVINLHLAKANEKFIHLTLKIDENIPQYIKGDAFRIQRIILELVANALKFTHHGNVSVHVAKVEKDMSNIAMAKITNNLIILKMTVTDTGIGIPADKKEAIFVQFNRLHPAHQGTYSGAGIGLSIVKKFIEELQGEVYVSSKFGKGSTFTCLIPVSFPLSNDDLGVEDIKIINNRKNKPAKIKYTHTKNPQSTFRVLVVEDDPIQAEFMLNVLENLDCAVDIATNGAEALEKAKTLSHDLIFMDIGLPDTTGLVVTQKFRKFESSQDTHIPIIALTAHVAEKDRNKYLDSGMEAILSKPALSGEIESVLAEFMPQQTVKKKTKKTSTIELPSDNTSDIIIDIATAVKTLQRPVSFIKKLLKMRMKSLPEEINALETAYQAKDWEAVKMVVHKMRGGAHYCGLFRVYQACANLENDLCTPEQTLKEFLYQALVTELDMAQKAYENKNIG